MPRSPSMFDVVRRDLRSARRSLASRPLLSALAILTVALGIGSTSAIFSVTDGIVFRPFPYRDAGRLLIVWEDLVREGNHRFSVSAPNFEDIRGQRDVFADAAAQLGSGMRIRVHDLPELGRGARVTPNYFRVLGAAPALGRTLVPADSAAAGERVAVLSHALWKRAFAGDPAAIGRTIDIDGSPHVIVGVMPEAFSAPAFFKAPHQLADIWLPLEISPALQGRGTAMLQVVARLRDGVAAERAETAVATLAARLARSYPATNTDVGFTAVSLERQLLGGLRPALLTLLWGSGLLLLIAIANIANLLTARAMARRGEIGIRTALGARRSDLVRQLVTESLVVAAAGGAAGLLLAWLGTGLLVRLAPAATVRLDQVHLDFRVAAFAALLTAIAGVAAGILPALQGTRVPASAALQPARRLTDSRGTTRARDGLLVAQIALAVVLLVGAGLLSRTVRQLAGVNPGFDVDRLLTTRFGMPGQYDSLPEQIAYFAALTRGLEQVPGVRSVAFSTRLPLDPSYGVATIQIEGAPAARGDLPTIGARIISDHYFETMGIPLVQGRGFTTHDDGDAPPVVIVNRTMARRFWPGRNPVGQRIAFPAAGGPPAWNEVIGVAGDVSHDGIGAAPIAELYMPYLQSPVNGGALVIRTSVADPLSLAPALRRAATAVDPDQAFIDMSTMRETATQSVAMQRFSMLLLGIFSGFATLLTAVGLYGTLAYAVGRRTRELGVRIALGATPRSIAWLVGGRAALLLVVGIVAGGAGALVSGRLIASQLYDVAPGDPATLAAAVILLVSVAGVATAVPVGRAVRIEPVEALREE